MAGQVSSFRDLFAAVSKTGLALDMHTSPVRLTKLIQQPMLFTFEDCYTIAALLEVPPEKIIDLVNAEVKRGKKGRK